MRQVREKRDLGVSATEAIVRQNYCFSGLRVKVQNF